MPRLKPPPLPAHWLSIDEAARALSLRPDSLRTQCMARHVGHVVVRFRVGRVGQSLRFVPVRCVAERRAGGVPSGVLASAALRPAYDLAPDWPDLTRGLLEPLRTPGSGRRPALYYQARAGSTLSVAVALAPVWVRLPLLPPIRGR
jgi:hypothetical protein